MSGTGLVRVRGCLKGRYNFLVPDPGSGICFLPDHGHKFDISIQYIIFVLMEGDGRREWMGPGWLRIRNRTGSGFNLFYCASLSLYNFMFPAVLQEPACLPS